jgi:hypothetical protein
MRARGGSVGGCAKLRAAAARHMSISVSPIRTARRKPSVTGAAHVLLPLW